MSEKNSENIEKNYRPYPEYPILLKAKDAGEILGIGVNSVYNLVHSNMLRSIPVGTRILIPQTAIGEFLDKVS